MRPEAAVVEQLVDRIRKAVSPLRIVLFGSAARGEMGEHSDIDVLVVVEDGCDPREATRLAYRSLIGFGHPSDIVVTTASGLDEHRNSPGLVYAVALAEGEEIYAA
jgi:predicted nucleotidyltransferase